MQIVGCKLHDCKHNKWTTRHKTADLCNNSRSIELIDVVEIDGKKYFRCDEYQPEEKR
ncbi:MAG: hypothetical protein WCP79_06830 [Bacillota bacterium]